MKNYTEQELNSLIDKAFKLYDEKNYDEAKKIIDEAFEQGFVRAINAMGLWYSEGLATPVDIEKSISYFLAAADKGSAVAYRNIANLYIKGEHLGKDIKKALEFYEKAAITGDLKSFGVLTYYYFQDGEAKNIEKSIYWGIKDIEANPNDSEAWHRLCYSIFWGKGDLPKANEYIKQGLKKHPGNYGLKVLEAKIAGAINTLKYIEENKANRKEPDIIAWYEKNMKANLKNRIEKGDPDEFIEKYIKKCEDEDPPMLGLKDTPFMKILLINCDYHDPEQWNPKFVGLASGDEQIVVDNEYKQMFEEKLSVLTKRFGPATMAYKQGYGKTSYPPELAVNADYFDIAHWDINGKRLVLIHTEWYGDGDFSHAIHAVVASQPN